jgi:hypothetical protein
MLAELKVPASVPGGAVKTVAPDDCTIREELDEQLRFAQLYSVLYWC